MRKAVNVYRSADEIAVESTSMVAGRGRMADGWTEVVPADAAPERLGEAVLAGLEVSGVIEPEALPPIGGAGATPGARALGYETEAAMQAAGVASASVGHKGGYKVTPMVNEGAGRGFSGSPEAPPVEHEGDWSASEIGSAVLAALDAAAELGPRS